VRRRFNALAGAAGALACCLATTAWRLTAPPPFVASAIISVESDTDIPSAFDLPALRALAMSDAALRKAALAPEAAAAIAREARPGPLDSFLSLFNTRPGATDTLGRAADLLAARVELEQGATARSARVRVRMDDAASAAEAANAVARAIVASHNEAVAKIDRRRDRSRRDRLARAERRRDAARERFASLRAIDPAPTASIATAARPEADPSAQALAGAQRAATTAEMRRVEAARVYGPRHPEMIQIETNARRAAAALQTARARLATAPGVRRLPPAEGGPDPRAGELADAQEEVARAEAAYQQEAARFATPTQEARLVEPAQPPAGGDRTPTPYVAGAAALLGFLLFGAAPGAAASMRRASAPSFDRPHAVLRRGALDPESARPLVEALDIAASTGARRVFVTGDSEHAAAKGARALAEAALTQGWRPLLVGMTPERGAPCGALVLGRRIFAAAAVETRAGELVVARPSVAGRSSPRDADLAFDLVLFGDRAICAEIDVVIWIGANKPAKARMRQRISANVARLWIAET